MPDAVKKYQCTQCMQFTLDEPTARCLSCYPLHEHEALDEEANTEEASDDEL